MNAASINRAFDHCSNLVGGYVEVPRGNFLTGRTLLHWPALCAKSISPDALPCFGCGAAACCLLPALLLGEDSRFFNPLCCPP
jgi:hypothetical protein